MKTWFLGVALLLVIISGYYCAFTMNPVPLAVISLLLAAVFIYCFVKMIRNGQVNADLAHVGFRAAVSLILAAIFIVAAILAHLDP